MSEENVFDDLYFDSDKETQPKIVVATEYLINGEIKNYNGKTTDVYSPIYIKGQKDKKIKLGIIADLTEKEALEALDAAVEAYGNGRGVWPQMSSKERIECVENFLKEMKSKKEEIVEYLMWEICKNK
jgi:glyceraldehyde-3-phosphate dehydrogenase (NADP+)